MTNIRLNNNTSNNTNSTSNTNNSNSNNNNYINNNNHDLNLQELHNSISRSMRITINKMHELDHSDKVWQKLNDISFSLARASILLQDIR